jgi:hypothetical protein
MSTLQHTLQPAFRSRLALMIVLAGTLAALTVALIVATSGSSSPAPAAHASQSTLHRQLESVNGARYGAQPGSVAQRLTPQQQLEGVAGARYGIKTSR